MIGSCFFLSYSAEFAMLHFLFNIINTGIVPLFRFRTAPWSMGVIEWLPAGYLRSIDVEFTSIDLLVF
ncbi:MAG: hypothetical protein CVV64_00480 [Candidatus Wallbacteria bacterium HGW-Wallbacteria-1]|uniref:Uncharacterized protein n=1 Tax=Candidatus Wallbacteria bacterium HGW-Wallbacteria-1 TaxID=2013854 RepID=A0A2N1PUF7_9BACT|nr:MAG: hypothetical protein CVV64_00480 [Candidatus Wallbacteria bacterium HGW-Wallbacteria-1]